MFVSFSVGFEHSDQGFTAKIHYGNEINDIEIKASKTQIYFQLIVKK